MEIFFVIVFVLFWRAFQVVMMHVRNMLKWRVTTVVDVRTCSALYNVIAEELASLEQLANNVSVTRTY